MSSKYRKSACKVGLKYSFKMHAPFFCILVIKHYDIWSFLAETLSLMLTEYNVLTDHNFHLYSAFSYTTLVVYLNRFSFWNVSVTSVDYSCFSAR